MKDVEVKKQILQEIMEMMDAKEGDMLKSHPKLAKVEVETNSPEMAEEIQDKLVDKESEVEPAIDEDELDEETLEKLKDLYKNLK